MDKKVHRLLSGAGLGDILIPRKKFIEEHNHLISLLRESDKPRLLAEARDQSKELNQVLRGGLKGGINIVEHPDTHRFSWYITEHGVDRYPIGEDGQRLWFATREEASANYFGYQVDDASKTAYSPNTIRKPTGGSWQSGFIARMMGENRIKNKGTYKPASSLPDGSKMKDAVHFQFAKMKKASPFINRHFKEGEAFVRKRGLKDTLATEPFQKDFYADKKKGK